MAKRPSSIDRLPESIREEIGRLRMNGATLDQILAHLATMMPAVPMVFNGRDFALDNTWLTPVLMSLGCERRAHPDDALPSDLAGGAPTNPPLNPRRGWPGDALDPNGRLTGSRQWILNNAKLGTDPDDPTVALALSIDKEALSWAGTLGLPVNIKVDVPRRNVLRHTITIGQQTVVVPQVVGL